MPTPFADRLDAAVRAKGNPCLVGLDPHPELVPDEFRALREPGATRAERAAALADFCCAVIEVVAERAPAVKPQSAMFEVLGADGAAAWERVVRAARAAGLIVIGDVKRGDIGSTAAYYGRAFLEAEDGAACDAITVNPYLGSDALEPILAICERAGAGVYVLVRTSNPGSAQFQLHGEPPLADVVARAVHEWGTSTIGACGLSGVGAVVGATHPAELARLRGLMPRTPLLLPGYGAQGAGAADVVDAFLAGGRGALVNSSRGICFAHREERFAGRPWKDAVRAALDEMAAALGEALAARA